MVTNKQFDDYLNAGWKDLGVVSSVDESPVDESPSYATTGTSWSIATVSIDGGNVPAAYAAVSFAPPAYANGGMVTFDIPAAYAAVSFAAPAPEVVEWVVPEWQCPHCKRDWHDGALTERVAKIMDSSMFDYLYDPDCDDTPFVCVGSDVYGPELVAGSRRRATVHPEYPEMIYLGSSSTTVHFPATPVSGMFIVFDEIMQAASGALSSLQNMQSSMQNMQSSLQKIYELVAWPSVTCSTWLSGDATPKIECPEIPVKFGIEQWKPWEKLGYSQLALQQLGHELNVNSPEWYDKFPVPSGGVDYDYLIAEFDKHQHSYGPQKGVTKK